MTPAPSSACSHPFLTASPNTVSSRLWDAQAAALGMLPVGGQPPAPTVGTPAPEPTPPLLTICWTSVPKANKPQPEHWLPQSSPSPSPPLLDPGSIPPPPLRLPHLDAGRVCPNAAFPKKFSEAQILSASCVPGLWACPRTGVRARASCPKHDINLKALVLFVSLSVGP